MKIIILGAGQVGATLAENLVIENHDIVMIDHDLEKLNDCQQRLDIRTVNGLGAHPQTLEQANIQQADLMIAVSDNDETNMIACQIAYSLYRVPTRIARIRSRDYSSRPELFAPKVIPINKTISPEEVVTDHFCRLIEFPGTMEVLDFAEGKVLMLALKLGANSPLIDCSFSEIKKFLPLRDAMISAVYRRHVSLAITESLTLLEGDELIITVTPAKAHKILKNLNLKSPNRKIMIAGGGNIGLQIAKNLEPSYQVKLIDHNPTRSGKLAEELNNTTILFGDASDRDILVNENIDYMDVFVAVTNDDEVNIMSCLLAKQLGARSTLALINRSEYISLVEPNLLDVALSPQQITIGKILTHIRHGDLATIHSVRRGIAQAIEIVAHGDNNTSQVVGRRIDEISWPRDVVVTAVVRQDDVLIHHKNLVIESDDHVIILVKNKKMLVEVEKLFQVKIGFI